jgi:hypothetical protein
MEWAKRISLVLWLLAIGLVSLFGFSTQIIAATYYVSPTGKNSNPGVYDQPWQTVTYAINQMSGGDTLIMKDGIYYNSNKENEIRPPSGSPGNYTTIKAENDFQAVISGNGFSWTSPVEMIGASYIQIEGLKFVDSTAYESCIFIDDSNHIKLMKISIHNGVGADGNSKYGCPVRIRDSNYCLVEDVFVSGRMRYGILVRSEYSSKVSHHIILRRCVVRWDFANTDQPMAGISIYGTDGATTIHDILLQNCIVLDWNPGNYGSKNSIYGGFYTPHVTKDVTYKDCIALNIHGTMSLTNYDQILAGFMIADDKALNGNRGMYNCVSWDTEGPGIWIERGDNMIATLDQVTVGDTDSNHREIRNAVYDKALGTSTLTNSLIYNNTYTDNTDDSNFNWYYPTGHARGNNYITDNPNLKYIVRTTDTGTGQGGKKRGATIEKSFGVSGTLWGEAGYDTLTDEDLWPWPYEDQIKADFSQPNSVTSGCIPSTNNPKRGFCADGSGLYGGPITLTSYIWEYLGNPVPPEIYGSAGSPTITITVPTSSSTYSTTNGIVALGGTATDDVSVTNITWSNSQGGNGTAQGTTNWTISTISLQPGPNIITVTAQDSDGNTGTGTITVNYSIPDTVSPSTPSNLQATAISSSQINLSWNASVDDVGVTEYNIYRDGSLLTTQNSQLTTYSDTGLSASTSYTYTVSAYDAAGNESGQSDPASLITQDSVSFSQLFEAEDMNLISPMTTGIDTNASGGQYISPTTGTDSTSPQQEASFNFTLPETGTYYLWIRMMGPDSGSDVLYVGIDTIWDRVYTNLINAYEWIKVETLHNSGSYSFNLTQGTHTLQIGHGEINTRADAFLLTDDPNEIPTIYDSIPPGSPQGIKITVQ